ncbi:MAG: glycosyltransferase, partial [Thermodesulfobacteriota bacterium]
VNKDVLRTNTAIPPGKVVTVHNGIDVGRVDAVEPGRDEVRARLGLEKDAIVFGTVGRLAPTKGQVYLLEAFSMILKNFPNGILLIAGDGPLRRELERKAEDLGIAGSVRFLGYRSDVLEIMRSFDVFVFPSLAEGLPLALLEAMASRITVVASNVGGIPDVLGNGLYGRLVPPRDAASLATAMTDAALLSAEEKKKTTDAGRLRVLEEFTKEVMCKALTDVYRELSVKSI